MMKSIQGISDEITALEAERDYGDITKQDAELLEVLNLCYDLLCRTEKAQSFQVETPEQMQEPGEESDFFPQYGIYSNQLADFAFAIATKSGSVNLRALLYQIMCGYVRKDLAEKAGFSAQTISVYMNNKKSMTTDNYERLINVILK